MTLQHLFKPLHWHLRLNIQTRTSLTFLTRSGPILWVIDTCEYICMSMKAYRSLLYMICVCHACTYLTSSTRILVGALQAADCASKPQPTPPRAPTTWVGHFDGILRTKVIIIDSPWRKRQCQMHGRFLSMIESFRVGEGKLLIKER